MSLLGVPLLSHVGNGCSTTAQAANPLPGENEHVLRLLYNENPYGPSSKVREIITENAYLINRYATFSDCDFQDLKELIATQEGVGPENVLLGHGSFEVLTWVSAYFARRGGEIIVPTPTFDVVGNFGRSIGAEVKQVDIGEDFRIDLGQMEGSMTERTQLVTICNPNNPTGTSCDAEQLRSFCDDVADRAFVLVDEAYIHYLKDWRDQTMAGSVANDKNLLVTRTFSKMYGMAGLRIGFLLGPADFIKSLESQNTLGFPGNMPNSLSVPSAMAALQDELFVRDSRRKNEEVRSAFCAELSSLDIPYIESDTNFVYYDVENFQKYKASMWEHHILLAGGWPSKPNWARATISKPAEMDFLIDKMKSKSW